MTTAIVLSFLLAGACIVIAMLLLFRGTDPVVDRVLAEVHPSAPALSSMPATFASTETPPLVHRTPTIAEARLRLVSKGGHTLDSIVIPAKSRRVSLAYRVGKAQKLCTFVASQKLANGDWEYREVGTERE